MTTTKKVVLVTGCTTGGIGYETAKAFEKVIQTFEWRLFIREMPRQGASYSLNLFLEHTLDSQLQRGCKVFAAARRLDAVTGIEGIYQLRIAS